MSAVAAPTRARPSNRRRDLAGVPRAFDDRATLESVILSAWEGLVVEGRCACPICGGAMSAATGRASCDGCGSALD